MVLHFRDHFKMLTGEGVTSIYWFTVSCLLPVFGYGIGLNHFISAQYAYQCVLIAVGVTYLTITTIIFLFLRDNKRQVALCSSFLGTAFTVGVFVSVMTPHSWTILGWYICLMSFFHYTEFLAIAVANPSSLSLDSFMLNHSYAYGAAAAASWCEYFLELWFLPDLKESDTISKIGLVMCIIGEMIRKAAILTARNNFHHIVQVVKDENHQLVTHGVYSICRHPSYVGWFYWCIGTQLVLVNPVCTLIYAVCSWKFFYDRIKMEEATLLEFFLTDYVNYKKSVPSGLPFIRGCSVQS